MKRKYVLKGIYIVFVLAVLGAAMSVLNHTVKNGRQTESVLPAVTDTPVYVECGEGIPLQVSMLAKENFSVSGFRLLLVNISDESRGTVHITVKDSARNLLMDQVIPVDTITPGEWFTVSADISFMEGEEYILTLTPDGSEPYFMQLSRDDVNALLPFEETVINGGETVESGISLGVDVVTLVAVTFGEIFYYSVPLCIFAAAILIIIILFGREKILSCIKKIPFTAFLERFGNELFLVLLFAGICISIYSRAYLKGVYITSDSAGYLREAVNLVNGQGFYYDGMAGFNSWFANWPILYPALIAFVMLITGANAYLASKILSMITVGLILIVIRICYKKDAYVYALCLTNIGFLSLTYYTWSEIPFILFMLCFALVLAQILKEEKPGKKWYVLLGMAGLSCFLMRYYGIYVWIVAGLYLLLLLNNYRKEKDKRVLGKALGITISAFITGCLSLAYLLMNKIMNGMASGVSRSLWWDDYEKLTNDLIESLLTEFFNIFSLQIPQLIENFPFNMKALVLAVILIGFVLLIKKNCRHFTRESVMITMAVMYYVIFIGIRYVSSMDTFYFRFFEPGSFLLCMGIMGLLLPSLRGKRGFHYFGGAVTALIVIAAISVFENGGMDINNSYYKSLTKTWDAAYAEIPEKSVIIFNDIDFRSSYYRPDVVDGMINPEDTFETLGTRYYGSDYLCIRAEFVKTMLEEGDYDISICSQLERGLNDLGENEEFVVLSLKQKEQ